MMMGNVGSYLADVYDRLNTESSDSRYTLSKIFRAFEKAVNAEILKKMDLEIFLENFSVEIVDSVAEFPAEFLRFTIFNNGEKTPLPQISSNELGDATKPCFCVRNVDGVLKMVFVGVVGTVIVQGIKKFSVVDESSVIPLPLIFEEIVLLYVVKTILENDEQWERVQVLEKRIKEERQNTEVEAFRLGSGKFGWDLEIDFSSVPI